jgi:hypothetical protein
MSSSRPPAHRMPGVVGRILYWLAVLVISLAILVGLVLFLEARDASEVEGSGPAPPPAASFA